MFLIAHDYCPPFIIYILIILYYSNQEHARVFIIALFYPFSLITLVAFQFDFSLHSIVLFCIMLENYITLHNQIMTSTIITKIPVPTVIAAIAAINSTSV